MSKKNVFTFRLEANERKLLEALAEKLNKPQSEVIRLLVAAAAKELLM